METYNEKYKEYEETNVKGKTALTFRSHSVE